MENFKNILVGVDLTHCRRLDISELSANAREAIDHAIWLAKLNSARLLFFSVLAISEEMLHHLLETGQSHVQQTIEEQASAVLDELVAQAAQQGVDARAKLVLGKAWSEIICQVLRENHDLVVVGTRDLTGLRRLLFGNTALKLLRYCPCPVWVIKPGHGSRPLNILIATDLKPAGTEALRLGISQGRLMGGTIHALRVLEFPRQHWWGMAVIDEDTLAYRSKVRDMARAALLDQVRRVDPQQLGAGVNVHLGEDLGVADVAIQHYLQMHHIDLLVMGTLGRGGITGFVVGNTAERLLPEVHCSLLAVKPPDFQCPLQLQDLETRG